MANKDKLEFSPGDDVPEEFKEYVGEMLHDYTGRRYLLTDQYYQTELDRYVDSDDRRLEKQIAQELLNSNLRQLTDRQKDVILFTLEGLDQKTIATKLGISVDVVREHLRAARKKLKKLINGTKEILKEGLENGK